jgi:hypothetical protein
MQVYPISPETAKRAADDFLAIVKAGMLAELLAEIEPALIDGETRRTIVLDCLRNMANYARRNQPARQRQPRRATA